MSKKFDIYDYLILAFVLSFSVFIGLYHGFKRKLRNLYKFIKRNQVNEELNIELNGNMNDNNDRVNEYLTGNSSLGSIPVAFSLLASFYSSTALLGMPAEMYLYGAEWYLSVIGMTFFIINVSVTNKC
jgi:sodium-coupled monocarboxylate transporter 8/12